MSSLKSTFKRTLLTIAMGSVILTTASCSWLNSIEDPTEGWSADKLYVEGRDNLNEGNWETARDYYQKLEARYPFGKYAQQAQIETAYSYSVKEKCLRPLLPAIVSSDSILIIRSPLTQCISRALPHWTKMTDG